MFGSQADFSFTNFSPGSAPSLSLNASSVHDSKHSHRQLDISSHASEHMFSPKGLQDIGSDRLFADLISPVKPVPSPSLILATHSIFSSSNQSNYSGATVKRKLPSAQSTSASPLPSAHRKELKELNDEILAVRQLQN
jgi:hypothetical protein